MPYIEDLYTYEKLKWDLLERYRAISLEEVFDGEVRKNEYGSYYLLEDRISIDREAFSGEAEELSSYLRLVRGIGEKREKNLNDKDIEDIIDLLDFGKHTGDSSEFLEELKKEDLIGIYERIENNLPKAHPAYISLLKKIDPVELLFFDIETTGLKEKNVFLIGTGTFEDEIFEVEQFLAREKDEEVSLLYEFGKRAREKGFLISFNGRSFDINVINQRKSFYEMDMATESPHLDLLHLSKSRWGDRLSDCKLSTIEKEILDIEREKDLPSPLIPHFYEVYLENNNVGTIVPIINHNKNDLFSMAELLKHF